MIRRKVYWDTCVWLALLHNEPGRASVLRDLWLEAEGGKLAIITSVWSLAECVKAPAEKDAERPFSEEHETELDRLFAHSFVIMRQLDWRVAAQTRRLVRQHRECRKPVDAAHLATALLMNVDEMHTYDGAHLLALDGRCQRADGQPLRICVPVIAQPQLPLLKPALPRTTEVRPGDAP